MREIKPINARELLEAQAQRGSREARFVLAGLRRQDAMGGAPKASMEDGRIVFTYPNGVKTSGGVRIN